MEVNIDDGDSDTTVTAERVVTLYKDNMPNAVRVFPVDESEPRDYTGYIALAECNSRMKATLKGSRGEFEVPYINHLNATADGGVTVKRDGDLRQPSTYTAQVIEVVDEEEYDYSQNQPETVTEWKKWYPCPACGSTSFKQTETVTVHGTESGDYGGDDADFVEKVVCAECEVVLESE